jgi:Protein of unknown function (DUF642)
VPPAFLQPTRRYAAILAAGALSAVAVPLTAQNLVANGSFETPAGSGSGDIYSNNASFSLPGWTVSAEGNRVFLEYGTPFNVQRYSDGRQSLFLNGDGSGASWAWQDISIVSGARYRLTFTAGDEQSGRALTGAAGTFSSPATLRVSLGSVFQDFVVGSGTRPGKTFTWDFVATSALTRLRFDDTTPVAFNQNNPWIDGVSIVALDAAVVPEPATLALLAPGVVLLLLRRRRWSRAT